MRLWHLLSLVAAVAMVATLARSPLGLAILALVGACGITVALFGILNGPMTRLSRRASQGDWAARCERFALASLIVMASIVVTLVSIIGLSLLSRIP